MPPMPTMWWLRPLSSAARVGEHSAVVWKRLYLSPPAARRSAFGVSIAPPKALAAPKPTSSIRTTSTLGAPAGGRSGSIGGNDVSGSFASYVVSVGCRRSGTGRTSRPFWLILVLLGRESEYLRGPAVGRGCVPAGPGGAVPSVGRGGRGGQHGCELRERGGVDEPARDRRAARVRDRVLERLRPLVLDEQGRDRRAGRERGAQRSQRVAARLER